MTAGQAETLAAAVGQLRLDRHLVSVARQSGDAAALRAAERNTDVAQAEVLTALARVTDARALLSVREEVVCRLQARLLRAKAVQLRTGQRPRDLAIEGDGSLTRAVAAQVAAHQQLERLAGCTVAEFPALVAGLDQSL